VPQFTDTATAAQPSRTRFSRSAKIVRTVAHARARHSKMPTNASDHSIRCARISIALAGFSSGQ
jgi:hypothetical protein